MADTLTCQEERVSAFLYCPVVPLAQILLDKPAMVELTSIRCVLSAPPPDKSEWVLHQDGSGSYAIDWEDPGVQGKIKGTIDFLIKGCSCITKGCKSNACGCRKKSKLCGPGCEYQNNCVNLLVSVQQQSVRKVRVDEDESDVHLDTEDGSSSSA